MRDIPDEQERVPGLPHRAAARLADRNRHHRRRLPTPRERPDGPHRRPLGTRRRRSHPQTTSPPLQRRLRHLLDMAPRSRTTARPPIPLPQRRRSKSRMRSLQKSRTHIIHPHPAHHPPSDHRSRGTFPPPLGKHTTGVISPKQQNASTNEENAPTPASTRKETATHSQPRHSTTNNRPTSPRSSSHSGN